jgi:RNA polymerase sigma-70 factor (ECF subfamily)
MPDETDSSSRSPRGPTLDEIELIEAAARGRRDAFGELVRLHQDVVFRAAYLITRSVTDAKDVAQDAFVKAYARLPQLRDLSLFRPWLLRIVGNEARNRIRSDARWRDLAVRDVVADATAGSDPERLALQTEDYRSLLRAVDGLRGEERLVIACRYFLELSEAETAETLGWPKGTVKSRLSRAIERLRDSLLPVVSTTAEGRGGTDA